MRVTIKGLRQWIVGAAVLLVAVLAGFLLYGRYRFRRIEKDLPARLGANIQETANTFTYSQSSGGHTLFTLKASKEIQLKAGHVMLHDVDITMYGPPGSGRTDHIYGDEFAYDQTRGIATSQGEVRFALEGLSGGDAQGKSSIRVQTRGLTFVEKTGVAWTAGSVHFQFPRASGESVGANYDSKTGVLVLTSQVRITTVSNGKPAMVTADQATLRRGEMQAEMKKAVIDSGGRESSADEATVYFRKDGSAEKIGAQGHVRMTTAAGAAVSAETATILTDGKSQPQRVELRGGVEFASKQPGEAMHGTAGEGTLLFAGAADGQTRLRTAVFRREVRFAERTKGKTQTAERNLKAQRVDVEFAASGGKDGRGVEARTARAEGHPVMTMRVAPAKGAATTTRMSANVLNAKLGAGNVLRELDGAGGTEIVSTSADGARETSRGDVLRATFARPAMARSRKGKRGDRRPVQTVLETAIQDGHVVLTETPGKKAGERQPATLTGWADHAEYRAADQVLELTGHPRLNQGDVMQMSADRIDYHRDTQDATSSGDVKATYSRSGSTGGVTGRGATGAPGMGGSGPVHVIAEKAAMRQAKKQIFFYGTAQRPARMWQGSNALEAPAIEIDRSGDVLRAWSQTTGPAPEVRASFVSVLGGSRKPGLVQVQSERLVYSDQERRGDFVGSVTAQQGNETIRAGEVQVFLKPAESGKGEGGKKKAQGAAEIERLVASGEVVLREPGRRGEGERLVYTAGDGKYVLTGTAKAPPQLWDRQHGTTRGAAVIFNSRTGSVEVSGGKRGAVTETQAPK